MYTHNLDGSKKTHIKRRTFFKRGGLLGLGSLLTTGLPQFGRAEEEQEPKIREYRTLGRTGFKTSDISLGCTRLTDSNIIRYCYDKGINYIDTAEGYNNGDSERMLGQAMQHMDREKLFITTKLHLDDDESVESIKKRFQQCRERMQIEYVDALYMHSIKKVEFFNHPAFHQAIKELKKDGLVRFCGLSSHGPGGRGDSMGDVLTAAAEDGRFDLMLLVYNFMNREEGERVLEACKKNNVGTTGMKSSPRFVALPDYDPNKMNFEQKRQYKRYIDRGSSPDQAHEKTKNWTKRQTEKIKDYEPFFKKYDIQTDKQLQQKTVQWVLNDPRMNTVCISFYSFDMVDEVVPHSGTKLSSLDMEYLDKYGSIMNDQYCKHGCSSCHASCPNDVPVNTIMRYAYYFQQGSEKRAILKYANLKSNNALQCTDCSAPCMSACPNDLNVHAHLSKAHSMLTLA